jgi:hypothetical protein
MRWQVFTGRILACVLFVSALASLWVVWETVNGPTPLDFTERGAKYLVTQKSGDDPQLRRVSLGDALNVGALTRSERYEMYFGPIARPISYRLINSAGQEYRVSLGPTHIYDWSAGNIARMLVTTLATLTSVVVAMLLLLRRPGAIAFTFAGYCAFTIPTTTLGQAAGVPGGVLSAILQPLALLITAGLGPFALIAFALHFPAPLPGKAGKVLAWTSDVALALAAIATLIFFDPYLTDAVYFLVQSGIGIAGIVVLIVVTTFRYTGADGLTRRRLGWVLIGSVVAAVAVWLELLNPHGWLLYLAIILAEVLPITVAYAVLRHRVIDVGFALNRTLVFGLLTTTIIVAVSLIDWSVGKLLSQRQLATALEALVAIGFGVVLNTLHEHVGGLVERLLFRKRYIAVQRLEERIKAIDFAESAETVDKALTLECGDILELRSAAIFRSTDDSAFIRAVAKGWEGAATSLERDDLIVRMIRANEETLELAASGLVVEDFPLGDKRPDIAIPIVRRHHVMGIAFYGHRSGEAHLDPQERALLERAAAAAASAYDAIEAEEWRRDVHHVSPLPASRERRLMRSVSRRAGTSLGLPDPSAADE